MELFGLQFILLLFYIELSFGFFLNYMDIVDRKSKNRIVHTIGWLGIGSYKDITYINMYVCYVFMIK